MFKVLSHVLEMERNGRDIVHFEIGDPDFATPSNIVEAGCAALRNGKTHYTDSMGLPAFRETIRDTTLGSRGFRPDMNQVLITPGANIIIYFAVRCLVEPGEEVIVPDPGFPSYYSVLNFCGAVPVRVPLREANAYRMSPADVAERITDKTRLIILNSPHNPTGSVMTPAELNAVFDIAEKADVYLLCDEIYSRMIYEDMGRFYSPTSRDACRVRTILANGFSKAFAMTGWRVGCAIGPAEVIEKMGLLLQTTCSCVPPFVQYAGIEAVCGPQDGPRMMMREYMERRDVLVSGLNRIRGVRCLKPGGAFYVFPNVEDTGLTDTTLAQKALDEAGVAVLPGSNFGTYGAGHVRLCYATSRERIVEGVDRLGHLLGRKSA